MKIPLIAKALIVGAMGLACLATEGEAEAFGCPENVQVGSCQAPPPAWLVAACQLCGRAVGCTEIPYGTGYLAGCDHET